MVHKEFSLRWAQRVFRKPLLMLPQLHESNFEDVMSMVSEYLFATTILPHEAQCTEQMLHVFNGIMCNIFNTLSSHLKADDCQTQFKSMYQLMQILHIMHDSTKSHIPEKLHLHHYLSEIICLLTHIYDAISTSDCCAEADMINVSNIYKMYISSLDTLLSDPNVNHCCVKTINALCAKQHHTYGTLVTMQVFLTCTAQTIMTCIVQQEFSNAREQHICGVVDILNTYSEPQWFNTLHSILHIHMTQALHAMFTYRTLETYALNFMHESMSYTAQTLQEDSEILIYILNHSNKVMCILASQLVSSLRASLLIYIFNSEILINANNIRRLLDILKYRDDKQAMLQHALFCFNRHIIETLTAQLADAHVFLRSAMLRVTQQVFSTEYSRNNRRNALFKEYMYAQLEMILLNMHTDEVFLRFADNIMCSLVTKALCDDSEIELVHNGGKLQIPYSDRNIYEFTNEWLQLDAVIPLETVKKKVQSLDEINMRRDTSHTLYVALENTLKKAHDDITAHLWRHGKQNALQVMLSGGICCAIYYAYTACINYMYDIHGIVMVF